MGLEDIFRKAHGSDLSWQKEYSGREGYQRMYSELTESFFKEFPEMRERVAIYNFAEPQESQLARLHRDLGLKEGEIPKVKTEMATLHYTSGGAPRSVAWGVNPVDMGGMEKLTPENIDFMAWHLTHEMFHTLDMTADLRKENDPQLYQGRNQHKWYEAMADAGRLAMYLKNMGDNSDVLGKLQGFVTGYDASAPARVYSDSGKPYIGDDIEMQVNGLLPNKYDNGEILLKTFEQVSFERQARSYGFSGWKDSFETVLRERAEWGAVREENIQLQASSGLVLKEAAERFQTGARRDLELYRAEMVQNIGISPEEYVDAYFGSAGGYRHSKSTDNPTLAKVAQVMLLHQAHYVDWVRERQDFLPNAARMVAAHDFFTGKTAQIGGYTAHQMTDVECLEKSYQSYRRSGDPLDKRAAEIFAASYDGADIEVKRSLFQRMEQQSGFNKNQEVAEPNIAVGRLQPAIVQPAP